MCDYVVDGYERVSLRVDVGSGLRCVMAASLGAKHFTRLVTKRQIFSNFIYCRLIASPHVFFQFRK